MQARFLLICFLALSLPAQSKVHEAKRDTWEEVSTQLRSDLLKNGIVGASFVYSPGRGEDAWWMHHGDADRQTKTKVDHDTIFHWASITKTLTGIATLQLRDRKLLGIDEAIISRLPELKAVHGGKWDLGKVTIEQLLSHSAGFRASTWPWGGNEDWHPHEPLEWSQLVAMMPYTKLKFEPGSKFSYSNPGIIFVGRVIEDITGDHIEVFIDKNIFKPLGMTRSYFDSTPFHLLPHRSNNYSWVDGAFRANGRDFDTGITTSNGGWNAPIADVIRYLRFLTGEGDVLQRKSLESMWEARVPAGRAGAFQRFVGLSFFIYEKEGQRVIGHTGSQKAFQSFVLFDPVSGAFAIAALNSEAKPGGSNRSVLMSLHQAVLDQLMG